MAPVANKPRRGKDTTCQIKIKNRFNVFQRPSVTDNEDISSIDKHQEASAIHAEVEKIDIESLTRNLQVQRENLQVLSNVIASEGKTMGDEKLDKLLDGMNAMRTDLSKQASDIGDIKTGLENVTKRVGKLEIKDSEPEKQTSTPIQAAATGLETDSDDEEDGWNDINPRDTADDDGTDQWKQVKKKTSAATRMKLPFLNTEEDELVEIAGFKPARPEQLTYDKVRAATLKGMDETYNRYDAMEQQNFPSKGAWVNKMPKRREMEIRTLERKLEGLKNPATGRTERWRRPNIDYRWNIFIDPALYRDFQEIFKAEYPQEPNEHKRFIKKNINVLKRQVLLGPFLQGTWR